MKSQSAFLEKALEDHHAKHGANAPYVPGPALGLPAKGSGVGLTATITAWQGSALGTVVEEELEKDAESADESESDSEKEENENDIIVEAALMNFGKDTLQVLIGPPTSHLHSDPEVLEALARDPVEEPAVPKARAQSLPPQVVLLCRPARSVVGCGGRPMREFGPGCNSLDYAVPDTNLRASLSSPWIPHLSSRLRAD